MVGLVGAFLTAAYMTRCVYLTFFGEYRGHGHPHESEPLITVPLIILSVFSVFAGLLNAAPLGIEKFKEWVDPRVAFPELVHAEFDVPEGDHLGGASRCWASGSPRSSASGTRRRADSRGSRSATRSREPGTRSSRRSTTSTCCTRTSSWQGSRVRSRVRAYWFDQHVIDKIVNRSAGARAVVGVFTYDVIDQKVVDGAVNEIAEVTGETGGLLRYIQSGRVQRYALAAVRRSRAPEPRAAPRQHLAH